MNDTIPRELAEALIDADWQGTNIVVGGVPANFPSDIDVAGLVPLGYASRSRQHAVTVFASDESEAKVSDRFRDAIMRAGFEIPPHVPRAGFGSSEFARMQMYGRNDHSMMFFAKPVGETRTLLTVSIFPPVPKDRAGIRARMHQERDRAPMPLLPDPPGAHNRGSGSGSSGSFSHMHAELVPCLPLAPVVAHYDQQLKKLGWVNFGADVGESQACLCYKLTDTRGANWCGVFTVSARPADKAMYVAFSLSDIGSESNGMTVSSDSMESFSAPFA